MIKKKSKDYCKRIVNLPIYSFTLENDNRIHILPDIDEVKKIFNGNGTNKKKTITGEKTDNTEFEFLDHPTLLYYLYLGFQDFYVNEYLPLKEKFEKLKSKTQRQFDLICEQISMDRGKVEKSTQELILKK